MPRDDGTLVDAPYIPIWIKDKSDRLRRIFALVDSGADSCVIPNDMAEFLGLIQEETVENTAGIGGTVKVRSSKLSFAVKSGRENYNL